MGSSGELASTRVQPSQEEQLAFEDSATPLLPENVTASALPERMLTVREAARRLRLCTASVYKLCASGQLEHARILNVIRIPERALAALAGRAR